MLSNLNESIPVLKCLQYAMLSVFVYDYLLTLPREIEVVWARIFRISNLIYFTTRYLPLVNIIYAIVESPVIHCNWVLPFILSLVIVTRVGINITLIARTFAVCTRHRFVVIPVAALGVSELVFDSFLVSCHPLSKYMLATVLTRLLFESSVIVITTMGTLRNFTLRNALDARTLAGFVMTHGALYFFAVFCLELMFIAVMRTQIHPEAQLRGSSGSYPLPVVAILISRFHLGIRHVARPPYVETEDANTLTTVQFISQRIRTAFTDDFRLPDTSENSNTVFSDSQRESHLDKDSNTASRRRSPNDFEMSQVQTRPEA